MPPSLTRHLPVASKFSSARPSGSITRWHDVHAGLLRCCSMRSRTDSARPDSAVPFVSSSAGTFGGGGGGGDAEQHFHHPLAAHAPARCDRRSTSASGRCRGRECRGDSRARVTRRNSVPVTFGNAVVARDAFVHEGVVGGQQIEQAAILAHQAVEEQLGLLASAPATASDPQYGIQDRIRHHLLEVLQPQPLRREARGQRIGARRRSACAAPASSSAPGSASRPCPAASAARRPVRCPTGRTTAATPARSRPGDSCAPVERAGVSSTRNRNCGLARIASSALVMPASKLLLLAAARVERHQPRVSPSRSPGAGTPASPGAGRCRRRTAFSSAGDSRRGR